MRKLLVLPLISIMAITCACSHEETDSMVAIKGGTFKNTKSNYYGNNQVVSDFYMSKYEVTQKQWNKVMGSNPSEYKDDNMPVEMVSWYDCIEYCNERSKQEGLGLYYNINKEGQDPDNICEYDNIKWTVTCNENANGYRLPTEVEWEYAASGGQKSKSYTYSGSNDADDVAWYWRNSGDEYLEGNWNWSLIENNHNTTKTVGLKKANELGLYDMSGNVREWCWEWYQDLENENGFYRVWKGGGLIGDARGSDISYRGKFEPNGKGSDQGLRVCRNK